MAMHNEDATRPAEIEVDPEAELMRIVWQDEHESLYELSKLRMHCPCAGCKGEMGIPGAVRQDTVFTAQQTTLVDMQEVGRYALQPFWADGHHTGYYPFTLLRALCPCAACQATNRAGGAT